MRREVAGTELLARWGGEQFVAMLPDLDKGDAVERAERLRAALAADDVQLPLSVGVAGSPEDGRTLAALLAAADQALYDAKRQGRDRVVAASPALSALR